MRRRGSGTTGGRFFVRMLRLGIRSKRSIVAALIDRILWRISSSSFKCPLRSSAGNRMGSSALRPLERWASMGLPALRLRRAVQDTDCRLFVIPRRRYELLQDPALILTRCGRIVGEFHAHGMHHLHLIFIFMMPPCGGAIMAATVFTRNILSEATSPFGNNLLEAMRQGGPARRRVATFFQRQPKMTDPRPQAADAGLHRMIVGEPGLQLDQHDVCLSRHLSAQRLVMGRKLRLRPAARLVGRPSPVARRRPSAL